MSRIISIHSFRGGTGKSNTSANIAAVLAADGYRVGVVDTDIQSPGIHVLFNLEEEEITYSLNSYLWGECKIDQIAYDVTERLGADIKGKIFLIPSSLNAGDITKILRYGYDMKLLNEGFHGLIDAYQLDVLLIDTHPGLNEETLLSISISDVLVLILRPDQQDYLGTNVALEVSRQLDVPKMYLLVNKTPEFFDIDQVRELVEQTYQCDVAAVLPHSDEMMGMGSAGLFTLKYPDHVVSQGIRQVARKLMS